MQSRIWTLFTRGGIALMIAGALVATGCAPQTQAQGALANTPEAVMTPAAPTAQSGQPRPAQIQNPTVGPSSSLVAVAAEQLGMTQVELVAELQSGKRIVDVANERGVAVETIIDAFIAPRAEQLAAMVENGQITQAVADSRLAMMRAMIPAQLSQPGLPQGQQHGRGQGPGQGQCVGAGYVDEDGDGICDYAQGPGQGPGTGAGQGQQPGSGGNANPGRGAGQGPGTGAGQGRGRGPGQGQGQCQGPNFVDANGNGICDLREP